MKPDAARAELIKADEQWARAWAARDLSGLMLYFREDAVVVAASRAVTGGKRDIVGMMSSVFSLPGFSTQLQMTRAESAESGDLGYTMGTYRTTVNDAAGKTTAHDGHYVAVWKKGADRTWKIAVYSATPVNAAAKKQA